MMYNKLVEELFFSPKHVGVLDLSEPRTVYFSNAQFSKEVVVSLYMQCDEANLVSAISFTTNGNPYVIASLEWLCREVFGKKIEHWSFNYDEAIKLFNVPFNQAPVILHVQNVYKEVLMLMKKKIEGEL